MFFIAFRDFSCSRILREILAGSKVEDEYLQHWIEKLGLKAEWGKI
jgi:hypothetical protein